MNVLKQVVLICLFYSLCTGLQAQESKKENQSIDDGSIEDQFEFVMKKSSNWKDENGVPYEVIRRNMIVTLKEHTLDSLNAIQLKLDSTESTVQAQENEINSLKKDLIKTQERLDAVSEEKDSMVLFGASMSKIAYNLILWMLIVILLLLMLVFIFKFKRSNILTRESKKNLDDLEAEFEEHRRVALEREQKVRRMLQDEINKNKDR
jgi:septal ring factor EnvC (AmiA/AmiB activator)